MIDLTKKYRTRRGSAVEIFSTNCVDCLGQSIVTGCYRNYKGQVTATEWFPSGSFFRNGEFCELDLIEDIPVPVAPERLSLTADEIANAFTTASSTDHALGALGFTMQPLAPREIVVDFWVNVYEGHTAPCIHDTAAKADAAACPDRVACLHVKQTVNRGDY